MSHVLVDMSRIELDVFIRRKDIFTSFSRMNLFLVKQLTLRGEISRRVSLADKQ